MNSDQLYNQLDTTLSQLHRALSAVPEAEVNTVPFPGSWTSGQLVRHLILSNFGFLQLLSGPARDTTRPYDAQVENIKALHLNFTNKTKSADVVTPPAKNYDKDRLLASLDDIKAGLLAATNTLDLTQTATAFELPVFGHLTRWEALHFVLYHTQRHIHQLKNMMKVMGEKESGIGN